MARRKRAESTENLHMEQPSDIIIPSEGPAVIENEKIAAIDTPLTNDYMKALAFAEEKIVIMIQPSSEENAPTIIDVYVNGVPRWIPVGENVAIERKYVENLIRSKPMSVTTQHESLDARPGQVNNKIVRNLRSKYPLTIIEDKNPLGPAWLRKVMAEQ